jgi:transcription antitermination factor NusG
LKNWLVFYTKSRQEKKVHDLLTRRGFEVFLPLQKVMRQWSDRKKKVEVPLFNSYIFVRADADKIPHILQTPGIAWNIRHNDKPAILQPKEVDLINQFLSSGLLIDVSKSERFEIGDHVEIMDGQLKGIKGQLIRTATGDRFMLSFESIGTSIQVEIDHVVLKKL